MYPARFNARAVVDAEAQPELRLEQQATAEVDLAVVGILESLR